MTYITCNETHNFYLLKTNARCWYAIAVNKKTEERMLAGFTTKKVALNAITSWKEWV